MASKSKSSLKVTPMADRVLIEAADQKAGETKSAGGIIIPVTEKEERVDRGTVVAVGEGRTDKDGNLIPMNVKVGDNVLFQWGDKVTIEDKEYYIVSESSILAVTK